jgi:hypothetical protein
MNSITTTNERHENIGMRTEAVSPGAIALEVEVLEDRIAPSLLLGGVDANALQGLRVNSFTIPGGGVCCE